ncbi:MAG: TraR/DksA family transcriptional regulator [Pseudomonadales bacterium]
MNLNSMKEKLLNQRAELLALEITSDDASEIVELDQTSVGRLSRMDAMQGQAMAIETRQRRKLELIQIDAALRRMDANDYGLCLECDNPIAIARLELRPSTELCINCASAQE